MSDDAVWAQTSTVGIDGTAELASLARAHGVGFVDAPVLGTRQPAEEGKLTVLAAGPTELRAAVAPVFDAIGAKTVWVGEEPGAAHRLKLVVNAWVLSVVAGTAQSIALAEGLGLDPQLFLDTIAGGAMDAPYVQLKGRAMIAGDYPPAFAVDGALKDSGLIREALRATGTDDRLMTTLNALFADAAARGPRGRRHGRRGGRHPAVSRPPAHGESRVSAHRGGRSCTAGGVAVRGDRRPRRSLSGSITATPPRRACSNGHLAVAKRGTHPGRGQTLTP